MQKMNERPLCHRAEDLVTYLYGEATAEEARDFSAHLQRCDACRAEFDVFNQVHESIVTWRNEALGGVLQPQAVTLASQNVFSTGEVIQHERRLSAFAAVREFFSVSPLWLRGATAFAGLLLCALIVFAVSRAWQQPTELANSEKKYSQQEFRQAVQKEVADQIAQRTEQSPKPNVTPGLSEENVAPRRVTARSRAKTRPANRLTQQEREQLAADLGLIPGREDELPFVLPDEPDQE